jgi:hypothetical protein
MTTENGMSSFQTETPRLGGAPGPRLWWRSLPDRRRKQLRAALAAAVLLVLVISVLLARFLTVENAERQDDLRLVQAEARGSLNGMLDQLSGCRQSRSCLASITADVANTHLRRPGAVKILNLESKTAYSLFRDTGETRLAWTMIGTRPVVQCLDVRRTGNFLTGVHVQLIGLSAPISGEATCWKRTRAEVEEEADTAAER